MTHRHLVVLLAVLLASPGVARRVAACAVCSTADTTLVPAGGEAPYEGRLRTALDVRLGRVRVGEGADALTLADRRVAATVSYARGTSLVGLTVPWLTRWVALGAARAEHVSLGDVEARLDVELDRSRRDGVRARRGLLFELHLPTAPVQSGPDGAALPSALQPGCSALLPVVGAYLAVGTGPWSLSGAVSGRLPVAVRSAPHAGPSLRATLAAQIQPEGHFAVRTGLDARLEAPGELRPGEIDPNSGGFVGYATFAVVTSPLRDLVLSVGFHAPVLQRFRGTRAETTVAAFAAAYDL